MRGTDRWLIASLPGRTYGRTSLVRRVLAPLLSMFMTAAERESPPSPARADIGRSPFVRLRELLGDSAPGKSAISLAVGEPQHAVPAFVGPILAAHIDEFGRYPMNKGLDPFCEAAAAWLGRRFALPRPIDPAQEVLVLNGSREGLFLAAIAAARWADSRPERGPAGHKHGRPAMLIPNPFYAAYAAGAVAADCEPVYLDATAETGFLPDLDAIDTATLERTALFYLVSPGNPQGACASLEYLKRAIALARKISADALFARAARLSRVDVKKPAKVIGTNTVDNVQNAGFRLRRVENVYLDVVKIIEAVKGNAA